MYVKLTLLEREMIGIGVYKTMYETNIEVNSNPAIGIILDRIEKEVYETLGISEDAKQKDEVLKIGLLVRRESSMGIRVPGSHYTLVITDQGSVTRVPEQIRINIKEGA